MGRNETKAPGYSNEPTPNDILLFQQWMKHFEDLKTFVASNGNDVMPTSVSFLEAVVKRYLVSLTFNLIFAEPPFVQMDEEAET